MILTEFYRQKLVQLNRDIQDAEIERDFKKVAKLQVEKVDIEKRIKEKLKTREIIPWQKNN
ncbi:hypothetical protein [Clostridium sp. AWRP]|uniref:hypothetical protein n=1 Tax=Clostridium sp. AWRP TaxID=2212991 RepID=UPI000FD7294A|nr:hypothetical protein [Clostridium sp. AWRP]AZV56061.1 hypothetical protein DMR38_05315 [Clostridium sp. AWRP]